MLERDRKADFQRELLAWFDRNRRDLPWRRTRDPYAIWISEIMLQQTRVAAVIPFYERFLSRFPDFRTLAEAPEHALLAHWAGLGYYYRARNLQKAARRMLDQDCFPTTYADIRSLPGVGEYTSAAVASIAFDLPFAALDGNVLRVLSRVYADGTDIGSTPGRKHFAAVAQDLLAREQPGNFNQAMMELGATICLPKKPLCLVCPVSHLCQAKLASRQNHYPVKLKRTKSVVEDRVLFWIQHSDRILLWQRPPDSQLMPGFWELPEASNLSGVLPGRILGEFRHGITFHNYRFQIREAEMPHDTVECRWVSLQSLTLIPISTVVRKAQRLVQGAVHQVAAAG